MNCELFLIGKCYNPYCEKNHLNKIDDNIYIISDTDYVYYGNPSLIDPKYDRKDREKHMSDLEKLSEKIQFEANEKAMENQLQLKKNIYNKEFLQLKLNNYEMITFKRLYPHILNDKDIINNKLGFPSSYYAAINNNINWEEEKNKIKIKYSKNI